MCLHAPLQCLCRLSLISQCCSHHDSVCVDGVWFHYVCTHHYSVRVTTYERLLLLGKGVLSRVMKAVLSADPLSPVLTDRHLIALDRRLEHVLYEIEKCLITHKPQQVLAFWTDSPEMNY